MPVPLIAVGIMAGMQMMQGQQQADSIMKSAEFQRQINAFNAQFAEDDAYDAEIAGYTEVARYATQVSGVLGEQRTAMAAANVDVNFGTAAEIQGETKLTGFLNTLDLQQRAREKAYGFKREARNIRLGSSMRQTQASLEASGAQSRGVISAAGTSLSGWERHSSTTAKEGISTKEK